MMRRREFIMLLGGTAAAWPLAAGAQQTALPVVGWLDSRSSRALPDKFRQGLADMAFVEGRNVAVEYRVADGHPDRLPALAADLVLRRVAVIVAWSGNAALAAKAATQTVPVVFVMGGDPVETGLVASLNRPAGNLTGVAIRGVEIASRRLELLHKLVPAAELLGMLSGPADGPFSQAEARDTQSAARALGVRLLLLNVRSGSDIAAAFAALVEQRAGALLIGGSAALEALSDEIISLAARQTLPTMFFRSSPVSAGGLSSYGPDLADAQHRAGVYTGRILKGERPADLPVDQATRFAFAINLHTAKALGLNVSQDMLSIADEVIE